MPGAGSLLVVWDQSKSNVNIKAVLCVAVALILTLQIVLGFLFHRYFGPIAHESVWFVLSVAGSGVNLAKLFWFVRMPLVYPLMTWEVNKIFEDRLLARMNKAPEK